MRPDASSASGLRFGAGPIAHRTWGGDDVVLALEHPPILVAADGIGADSQGAARYAADAVAAKAPILDKLARATETDRKSGARLALGRTLERLFEEVHAELVERGRRERTETAVALGVVVVAGGAAHVAHVGATRAYVLREGRLRLLTEDHTAGMTRLRQGTLTPEEYRASPLRDRLYQALGAGSVELDVDFSSVDLADGDLVLLCTPGVHSVLDEERMAACLSGAEPTEDLLARLLDAVGEAGGIRDASALAVRIVADAAPATIDSIAAALAGCTLFRDLTEAERLVVAPYLDSVALDRGEVLFSEGDPADAFYVLVQGRVRVARGGTPLTEIGAGGGFGELCLAGPTVARSAAVIGLEPASLLGLSRSRFEEIVARRPAIGAKLLRRALDWVGERLRDLTDRLARVEQLAIGEIKPGDLALRTAIVLAARGEWGDKGS